MNRASLLHILDHASGISEAEVRELEQLAAAFPYCQTAHLLLAKAAHDRGSMLAGQRLRRAATYAADRELLRGLIELRPAPPAAVDSSAALAEPTTSAASLTEAPATPEAPALAEAELPETAQVPFSQAAAEAAEVPAEAPPVLQPEAAAAPLLAQDLVAPETAEVAAAAPQVAAPEPDNLETAQAEPAAEPEPALPELTAALTMEGQPEPAVNTETVALPSETDEIPAAPAEPVPAEAPEAPEALIQVESTEQPTAEPRPATAEQPAPEPAGEATAPAEAAAAEASAAVDATLLPSSAAIPELAAPVADLTPLPATEGEAVADELPAAAPPIRPPVEAGSSRFEFGLGDAPEAGPAYQLPELPEAPAPTGIPAYRADELLAYALSSGSRFGAALTLRDAELTTDLPTADAWHPDAPVLAHYAAHRPAAPVMPSSLALIDKFLRSQPRIKTAQRPAPTDAPQADLSVRSTSAAPSLASESLAKIMVKQGKIGRAIEIYEQLMQRQPEKKAYFAAQIDLLTQQPE